MRMKSCTTILAMLLLTSCAATLNSKYAPPTGKESSTINFVADTDSKGALGRHYNFFLAENNLCSTSDLVLLGGKLIADDHQELSATSIPAGKPITLTAVYREGRLGQIRSCGNVVKFTPVAGQDYTLNFEVINQAAICNIAISDSAGLQVNLEKASLCYAIQPARGSPIPNGIGFIENIAVQVYTVP